eukprot:1753367-Amphidinium_carterae.1
MAHLAAGRAWDLCWQSEVVAVMIQTFGAMSIYGLIGSPLTYPFFADVSVHGPLMRDGEVLYPGVPG